MAAVKFAVLCLAFSLLGVESAKLPARRGYSYEPPTTPPPTYFPPPSNSYLPSQPSNTYLVPQETHHTSYVEPSAMPMPFAYGYGVEDNYAGIDFGHETNSDGKLTTGRYEVLLPDGRKQIVSYTSDSENGFQADVKYEGEARPYVAPVKTYEHPKAQSIPHVTYDKPSFSFETPKKGYNYQAPSIPFKTPTTLYRADF